MLSYCIKVHAKLDQFLVQIQQLGQHTSPRMSEEQVSPTPKVDKKSSIKKSLKPDQSKSKKKPVGFMEPPISEPQNPSLETTLEEKPEPKSQTRSTKRQILEKKNEQAFIEHMKQAEKSEKCGKIMKSINRSETAKEGHHNVESNQRQFSLSKEQDQALDVSKKKVATESKKNKAQDLDSTHPKTEEKVLSNISELQKEQIFDQNVDIPAQNQKPEESNQNEVPLQQTLNEIKPTQSSGKNMKAAVSKTSEASKSKDVPSKEGELSKKRTRPIKDSKDTDEVSQDSKLSKSFREKSSKKPLKSTGQASKSKVMGASGVKKVKPSEKKIA